MFQETSPQRSQALNNAHDGGCEFVAHLSGQLTAVIESLGVGEVTANGGSPVVVHGPGFFFGEKNGSQIVRRVGTAVKFYVKRMQTS